MRYCRRLPMDGLKNARDLGGFAASGGITRFGVYVRSEIPSLLSECDIALLRNYGIRTDIDVRGDSELKLKPDILQGRDFINYLHIPMADRIAAQGAEPKLVRPVDEGFRWGNHYITMCEHQTAWIRRVLTALAEEEGAILFHCTTGKDRTGIITALVLGLCGVDEMDIAADYCVSEIFLKSMYETMSSYMPESHRRDSYHPEFFSTSHVNMTTLLEHLHTKYGGIRQFVEACEVGEDVVSAIRGRLVEKNA